MGRGEMPKKPPTFEVIVGEDYVSVTGMTLSQVVEEAQNGGVPANAEFVAESDYGDPVVHLRWYRTKPLEPK